MTLLRASLGTALLGFLARSSNAIVRSRSSFKFNDKIGRVNTLKNANPGEFPFFAQWGGCAATLIWEDILLTSAACDVVETNDVLVGAYVSMKEEGDSVKRKIMRRQRHPDFDPETLSHNVMVLKLDQKVDSIPTVWIQEYDDVPDGAELAVVGFGSTASRIQITKIDNDQFNHTVLDTSETLRYGNDDGPMLRMNGAILQTERIMIVPHDECNADDQFAGFVDNNTMLCVGDVYDGSDICFGDSGGPLCIMANGECIQIGIVSFGSSCAIADRPGVFSRISSFYEWIEKQICDHSYSPPSACPSQSPTPQSTVSSPPSSQLSEHLSIRPSFSPIEDVSGRHVTDYPSLSPSERPSAKPRNSSSSTPSSQPSSAQSSHPSLLPSSSRSNKPSDEPSKFISEISRYGISAHPSTEPSSSATDVPFTFPTPQPFPDPKNFVTSTPHHLNLRHEYISLQDSPEFLKPSNDPSAVRSETPSTLSSRLSDNLPRLFPLPNDREYTQGYDDARIKPSSGQIDADMKGHSAPSTTPSLTPSDKPEYTTESPSAFPSLKSRTVPTFNPFSLTDGYVTFALVNHISFTEDDNIPITRRRLRSGPESIAIDSIFKPILFPTTPPIQTEESIGNDETSEVQLTKRKTAENLSSSPWISSSGLEPDGLHLYFWVTNTPNKILGPCEGDCDTDTDCGAGLYCYLKPAGEPAAAVPGCVGVDSSGTDFCTYLNLGLGNDVVQQPNGVDLFRWQNNPPGRVLGPCEGDCDDDTECRPDLYCFKKVAREVKNVPGCVGRDESDTDFCTYRVVPSSQPTPMPSKRPTPSPSPKPTTMIPTMTYSILKVFPENPPKESDLPLQLCEGDCDYDTDCAEGLICYMKKEAETTIPWCSGTTTSRTQFCTYANGSLAPTARPTPRPTQNPTLPPTARPTPRPTQNPTPVPILSPTLAPTSRPTSPPTRGPMTQSSRSPIPNLTKAPTPLPTRPPTIQPKTSGPTSPEVSITLAIFFDPWPEELSWSIENKKGVISSVPAGTYSPPMDHVRETISVNAGNTYTLIIEDSAGDGIAGIGNLYVLSMTYNPEIILAQNDGVFAKRRTETFYVPNFDEYPTSAPVPPSISPAPTVRTVTFFLTITFDDWHQETAWQIVAQEDPTKIFAEAVYDTYRYGDKVTEDIRLPVGRSYLFFITDFFDDGIDEGSYEMSAADGTVIFQGDGNFGAERIHQFSIPAF